MRTARRSAARPGDAREEVVEGADRAAQQDGRALEQLALDPPDVRPPGHHEHRVALDRLHVAVEEQRDFARIRRPGDERETHRPMLVRASDAIAYARRGKVSKVRRLSGECRRRALIVPAGVRPAPI